MYSQAEALELYTELRALELWVARFEGLPASDTLRVLLPAVRDRVALLRSALAAWCDPVTLASLDDLQPPEPRAPVAALVPDPPGHLVVVH